MEQGTTLWLLTSARSELLGRIQDLTGQKTTTTVGAAAADTDLDAREEDRTFTSAATSFIASVSVYLMLAKWASEHWRGYVRWLEQELEGNVSNSTRRLKQIQLPLKDQSI
jgi:hypothetical protein